MGLQSWVSPKSSLIGLTAANHSKSKLIKCFTRIKDLKTLLSDKKFMKEQVTCEHMNDSYSSVPLHKHK